VPALQVILSLGAMVRFFALCLSCINVGGRVIYARGRHGNAATADSHEKNETPHVAVTLMALFAFGVPAGAIIGGLAPLDCFNYVGTCAAFGFIVAYGLVTVAAPAYLKGLGEMTGRDAAASAAALVLLAVPAVGSVYPIPDPPVNYFPYLFLVYRAGGIAWIFAFYRRKPSAVAVVQADLDRSHSVIKRRPRERWPAVDAAPASPGPAWPRSVVDAGRSLDWDARPCLIGVMDEVTSFGLFAVTAMSVCYALETRSRWYVLGFAGACVLASSYGSLQGAWPFGWVEAIWALVALRRWHRRVGATR
jgi:hypothetical protein